MGPQAGRSLSLQQAELACLGGCVQAQPKRLGRLPDLTRSQLALSLPEAVGQAQAGQQAAEGLAEHEAAAVQL
ncbi:hypothetical protein DBR47_10400 [Paucibacter sp. KBW04]|nr:hypothetical protein DBR47_10400 [Paucibacter sp. KBW04]